MKGLSINGFTVVETLGSGQGGILYLARDAAGREAIVRVARDGEDSFSVRIFHEEASKLLPAVGEVTTTDTADGRRVLFATTPLPRAASANTQQLETARLPAATPPVAKPRSSVGLLLLSFVVLGAGASFFALSRRAPEPVVVPVPVAAPVPAPSAPAPVAQPIALDASTPGCRPDAEWRTAVLAALDALEHQTPSARAQAFPLRRAIVAAETESACDDVERRLAALAVAPPSKPAGPVAKARPRCIADSRWQRAAEAELRVARAEVARRNDDAAWMRYEREEEAVMRKLAALPEGADCVEVDRELDHFFEKWR